MPRAQGEEVAEKCNVGIRGLTSVVRSFRRRRATASDCSAAAYNSPVGGPVPRLCVAATSAFGVEVASRWRPPDDLDDFD